MTWYSCLAGHFIAPNSSSVDAPIEEYHYNCMPANTESSTTLAIVSAIELVLRRIQRANSVAQLAKGFLSQ